MFVKIDEALSTPISFATILSITLNFTPGALVDFGYGWRLEILLYCSCTEWGVEIWAMLPSGIPGHGIEESGVGLLCMLRCLLIACI